MREEMLEAYRLKVADVFRSVEGAAEFNGTIEHARVVTAEAFLAADSSVFVLMNSAAAGQFNCDSVALATKEFLEKDGVSLHVLYEKDFDESTSAFAKVVLEHNQKAEVRRVPEAVQHRYPFNFLTIDARAFRFQDDRAVPVALVGGGKKHAETTANLDRVFNEVWALSAVPIRRGPRPVADQRNRTGFCL